MSQKTKPSSIRFNEERLAFLMENEKLDSKQKAVDFLVDKYWWECRIGSPPSIERQAKPTQSRGEKSSKEPEKNRNLSEKFVNTMPIIQPGNAAEPKEGSGAFRLKYDGCATYAEYEQSKKQQ
jgi:hypothetical protein